MKLTSQEATVLIDALDMVLQGMSEARQAMIADEYTFETVDEFMETLGQQAEDMKHIYSILKKVRYDQRRRTSGLVRALRTGLQGHAG